MPQLGMSQDTGTVVRWCKKRGEKITVGEVLMEVDSDKAVVEVAAEYEGYLLAVTCPEGEEVPVGKVVALIGELGEVPEFASDDNLQSVVVSQSSSAILPEIQSASTNLSQEEQGQDDPVLASPKAKALARKFGFDLRQLQETGTSQPYHVADVKAFQRAQQNTPAITTGELFAEVAAASFHDFVDWAAQASAGQVTTSNILCAFAAAAWRAKNGGHDVVVEYIAVDEKIKTLQMQDSGASLSALTHISDVGQKADLIVYDLLQATGLTDYRPARPPKVPILTVANTGTNGQMTAILRFNERTLTLSDAIAVLRDFVGRLADPRRHLL